VVSSNFRKSIAPITGSVNLALNVSCALAMKLIASQADLQLYGDVKRGTVNVVRN
jgi:hypothetical protein